jgi:UDP-N-acetylmuramate dehydrogenase
MADAPFRRPEPLPWSDLAAELAASGASVALAQPLAELTTFRIGGPAALVGSVKNVDDASRFLEFADQRELPWACLGGGSNILGDDAGFDGLVLKVETTAFEVQHETIRVGAGWDFDRLIAASLDAGLVGLEFASGIPGTVGGAIVGNAGCYGHEIGEFLVEATVLRRDGRIQTLGPEDFAFAYRTSALKERGDIVLELALQLARGDLAEASRVRAEHLADRRRKHPWDIPCAGSYFQNLPPAAPGERRRAAGMLLDQAGARAMREGDAEVYEKHANIIVNRGRATSADVLRLAARMKQAVRDRFGEHLLEEVRHLVTPAASCDPTSD